MAGKTGGGIRNLIWNSEEGKCFGRTGSSWLKIGIFYILFYACLLAFWMLCLVIFLQTMNKQKPKWLAKTGSIIGNNPGLGFRPRPPMESIASTLIWYNRGKGKNWGHWVKELSDVADMYTKIDANVAGQITSCQHDKNNDKNKVCDFKLEQMGNQCSKQNKFGYEEGKTCVFIKLNKIYGWQPELYTNVKDLPKEMHNTVKDMIKDNFADEKTGKITQPNVWITCEGQNPSDNRNIGNITYYPHPGMPGYYYPYLNQPGYKNPLVAVQFAEIHTSVLVNVVCKAWAKNIKHDKDDNRGLVHFEIMVD